LHPVPANREGFLIIRRPWPAMARTIQNDHERFFETYLKPYPGYYFTGDGCRRDDGAGGSIALQHSRQYRGNAPAPTA